nr:CocE/NonD family hydrolase [Candidatus Sigynarchaeota archaeon]
MSRKAWFIAAMITFIAGSVLVIAGRFQPDEEVPRRFEFYTFSRYTAEINDFFNRSVVNPGEDAANKLVEDYWVRGYVVCPKQPPPASGYPAIIWMHGFGVNAESQLNYARHLAKNGFFAVALNNPGHGDSSGFWDMCIQELVGIYSAVDWLLDDSEYKTLIDPTRVGVAGHSLGGIDTTRAGIFDNWTNPRTGNVVGTGGRIRASCAIYCWDNLTSMAETLVQQQLGVQDIWQNPVVTLMLAQWRWFSNHDPSTINEETRIRSVSNFINATNIKNYCLITGSQDQFTSVQAQCHIMANSTIDGTGLPQVTWDQVQAAIDASPQKTWSFGNISSGNARRLVILPGQDHLVEAFSSQAANNLTSWFFEAMAVNGTQVIAEPITWCIPHFMVMGGCFVMAAGVILAIMPVFSQLSLTRLNPASSCRETQDIASGLHGDKQDKKRFWIQGCIVVAAIGASGFMPLPSITHYWIFDLIIPRFLAASILLVPCAIFITAWNARARKGRIQWENIGLHSSALNNLKALAIPCITVCICFLPAAAIAWLLQVPFFLPRPAGVETTLDFLTLVGIVFLFNILNEVVFRGNLFHDSLHGDKPNRGRRARWVCTLRAGIFSGLFIGAGFALNIVTGFGRIFTQRALLIPLIFAASIFANILLGILSSYIFRVTR